jgi:hypothetical protein
VQWRNTRFACLFRHPSTYSALTTLKKKAWFSLDIGALFFYSHFLKNRPGQSGPGLSPK